MKNRIMVALLAIVALVLLGSCSSLSLGFGYGGNTCDANNDYRLNPSVDLPSSGLSASWSATIRFGKDHTKSGFALSSSSYYIMGKRKQGSFSSSSELMTFSIGPAWEFVISNKFRLLVGAGYTRSGSYKTDEVHDDDSIHCETTVQGFSSLNGLSGFIDARYFFSDHWFLSLRGGVSRIVMGSSVYDCTIDGQRDQYNKPHNKPGFLYLATLGVGYNL